MPKEESHHAEWRQQALALESAAFDVLLESLPFVMLVDPTLAAYAARALEISESWKDDKRVEAFPVPASQADGCRVETIRMLEEHSKRTAKALRILRSIDEEKG